MTANDLVTRETLLEAARNAEAAAVRHFNDASRHFAKARDHQRRQDDLKAEAARFRTQAAALESE